MNTRVKPAGRKGKKLDRQVDKKVYLKGQVAIPVGSGVENFDPVEARKEVDSIIKDKDLIKVVPKFLLKKD